jgi:hypothetical protein
MRNLLNIAGALLMLAWPLRAGEKSINGSNFAGSSRNISAQGQYGMLAGFFTYGTAVYEFDLPQSTDRVKFSLEFDNLKGKWLKIYVYNYGTVYDDPQVRNKKIPPNWRLWQATDGTGQWGSRNPEYLYTTSSDARIDYLGPDNKIKLLLYADGGVPYLGDGRFLVKQLKLTYSTSEAVVPRIKTSDKAWIEGDFLIVKGTGKGKVTIELPGYDNMAKAAALRAAKLDAYRNLALALGKLSPAGGSAAIPGAAQREVKYGLGGPKEVIAEILLEVPLASLQPEN